MLKYVDQGNREKFETLGCNLPLLQNFNSFPATRSSCTEYNELITTHFFKIIEEQSRKNELKY